MKLEYKMVEFSDGSVAKVVEMPIALALGLDDADAHGDFSPESQIDMWMGDDDV